MNASLTPPERVYYLGPEGSFSASLVNQLFPAESELVPCSSFSEIAARLRADTTAVGLLGIENSNSSDVHETIDIMFEDKFKILGEASLKIRMNLIGLNGARLEQVREVYSHPQALLQCASFIQEHGLIARTTDSTSAGKQLVLYHDDPSIATIGSKALAEDGRVQVLAADIATVAQNMTRFICVSPTTQVIRNLNHKHDKLTYILQLKHRPGSLAHLLSALAELNVNLTKIQSKPIPGTDWEYVFWIDMEIPHTTERDVSRILEDYATSYTLLGAYEKGKVFES
ncbi:MAG TPA: prephenate dehydratase domain-containing protein [Chloroflexia bacterium]|nr:prephenate dehydratase domain-containing protein [Chloroflexia bacterium]